MQNRVCFEQIFKGLFTHILVGLLFYLSTCALLNVLVLAEEGLSPYCIPFYSLFGVFAAHNPRVVKFCINIPYIGCKCQSQSLLLHSQLQWQLIRFCYICYFVSEMLLKMPLYCSPSSTSQDLLIRQESLLCIYMQFLYVFTKFMLREKHPILIHLRHVREHSELKAYQVQTSLCSAMAASRDVNKLTLTCKTPPELQNPKFSKSFWGGGTWGEVGNMHR